MSDTTYHAGPCPITYSTPASVQPSFSHRRLTLAQLQFYAWWRRDSVYASAGENLRVLASVQGTWPFNSPTASLSDIQDSFNSMLSQNPFVSANQDQTTIRPYGSNSINLTLSIDQTFAFQGGLPGLEVMILNQDTSQFTLSRAIPIYVRPVTTVQTPANFNTSNPTFAPISFANLPTVTGVASAGQLVCTVMPYAGAPLISRVVVAFYDPRASGTPTPPFNDSSWVNPKSVTAPQGVVWATHPHGYQTTPVAYAPAGVGNQVVMIAYVDGVPSAPTTVTLT